MRGSTSTNYKVLGSSLILSNAPMDWISYWSKNRGIFIFIFEKYFLDLVFVSVWWPVIFLHVSRTSTQTCLFKTLSRWTRELLGCCWYLYLRVSCDNICSHISSESVISQSQFANLVHNQWSLWKIYQKYLWRWCGSCMFFWLISDWSQ